MIFITKKRLNDILKKLEIDSADQTKAKNVDDFYWRCGNANAVNYIRYKLGMEVGNDRKRP